MEPSPKWLRDAAILEQEFLAHHGNEIRRGKNVISNLTSDLQEKYPEMSKEAILCFIRTRTFIRMKHLNRENAARIARKREQWRAKKLKILLA